MVHTACTAELSTQWGAFPRILWLATKVFGMAKHQSCNHHVNLETACCGHFAVAALVLHLRHQACWRWRCSGAEKCCGLAAGLINMSVPTHTCATRLVGGSAALGQEHVVAFQQAGHALKKQTPHEVLMVHAPACRQNSMLSLTCSCTHNARVCGKMKLMRYAVQACHALQYQHLNAIIITTGSVNPVCMHACMHAHV